eukprot:233993-Prymnesium_polylepis.1
MRGRLKQNRGRRRVSGLAAVGPQSGSSTTLHGRRRRADSRQGGALPAPGRAGAEGLLGRLRPLRALRDLAARV